ncbi:MAG TPA: DUF3618 domain-containing protein [Pyrinomonadaceae bacterium]|nr:DUF3618 domain-containing protein [Pyrinomonadaceae bacterium]
MAEESIELTTLDRTTGDDLDLTGGRTDLMESDDVPPETEAIRARIEETRKEMGETIDAIQERLSLSNISEQVSETVNSAIESAKDTAYDATIGKAVNFMKNVGDEVSHSNAFRVVRSNPFPLALIGLGAGLLAYQAYNRGGSSRGPRQLAGRDENTGRSSRGLVGRAYEGISDRAGNAVDSVSEKANATYESVSGALSDAYTGAGDAANRAYDRLGEYGTIAHDKYDEYIEENPLAVGAVAMALGAAVGFAIPSTRYEGQVMGQARENVVQKVQDAAGTLVDKAKHAATEAGNTIREEAKALTE